MDNVEKLDVMDALTFFLAELEAERITPVLIVTANSDCTVTATNGSLTVRPTQTDNQFSFQLPALGNWTVDVVNSHNRPVYHDFVDINDVTTFYVNTANVRYGYRISKTESDPYECVEYLYSAVGFIPAHMDFVNETFDYGDWQDVWFVKDNKPCMLNPNGRVDYYLNPNDYSKKEDGTASQVTDTSTSLNAMSQIPLCYVYRYEDDNYYYEIVANYKHDNNYKAYAHTDSSGVIKPYFYSAMFGASGDATKLRSLSGQTLARAMQTSNQISGATANGSNWYIGTWSQHELIRTLLILISKSCDTQASFGNGNAHYPATNASYLLPTGTLSDKGQFFGYTDNNKQVKVFHIEGFWGDQLLRVAGVIKQLNSLYVKMTPEGDGYQFPLETPTGYTQLEFYDYVDTLDQSVQRFFTGSFSCSEFGMLPLIKEGETPIFGSNSTYFCDAIWYKRRSASTIGLLTGGCVNDYPNDIGAFSATLEYAITYAGWQYGCALSYI